jgi:hypothetical protein
VEALATFAHSTRMWRQVNQTLLYSSGTVMETNCTATLSNVVNGALTIANKTPENIGILSQILSWTANLNFCA